ncbi:MAG TPA: CAP domain-containing protein [Bacteriovoracaceae bacterium]|nr:CAP domain-containing protein [Bacteriovoracaceae bacterium]
MKVLFLLLFFAVACNQQASIDDTQLDRGSEVGTSGGSTGGSSGGVIDGTVPPTVIQEFLTLVNNHRATIGAQPLQHSTAMDAIARAHSENMADKSVSYSHDGIQQRCYQASQALGGGYTCAENIIGAVETADQMFSFWMSSPLHKANMENQSLTHLGLGWKLSSDTFTYWTLLLIGK